MHNHYNTGLLSIYGLHKFRLAEREHTAELGTENTHTHLSHCIILIIWNMNNKAIQTNNSDQIFISSNKVEALVVGLLLHEVDVLALEYNSHSWRLYIICTS